MEMIFGLLMTSFGLKNISSEMIWDYKMLNNEIREWNSKSSAPDS